MLVPQPKSRLFNHASHIGSGVPFHGAGKLLSSTFLGVWSRPNPEVSFVVYQQVVESDPADILGIVLRDKESTEPFFGCFQRQGRIGCRLSHVRNYPAYFSTAAKLQPKTSGQTVET